MKVSVKWWWCHKNTYERVIELVQPVFLNCTILKILKTLESLIAFSSFKVWPSIIDRRPIKIKKIWNGDDDDMAVDELSDELWFVHNFWFIGFLGWLDIIMKNAVIWRCIVPIDRWLFNRAQHQSWWCVISQSIKNN